MFSLLIGASASAQSGTSSGGNFLGLDVFGGYAHLATSTKEEGAKTDSRGGGFGATVRFRPWLGVTGEVARTSAGDQAHAWQYLGGLTVTSPYDFGANGIGLRVFAHVLGGYISQTVAAGSNEGSPEVSIGGGLDWLFLRLQVDWTQFDLPGRGKNNVRVLAGGVLPLCFRRCRPNDQDGLPTGKARGKKSPTSPAP